jgi:replicative DNA helicase
VTVVGLEVQPGAFADVEAEQACLGAILLDPAAIHLLRDLVGLDDWASERHQVIYAACTALADQACAIDPLTLRKQLERVGALGRAGGVVYLAELSAQVFTTANLEHHARIVREAAVRRRVRAVLAEGQRRLGDEGRGVEELAGEVAAQLAAETAPRGRSARTLADHLREVYAELERAIAAGPRGHVRGLRTGFPALDRMTGGLASHQLWLVGARPRLGKTTWALNVARQVAGEGAPVLVASLEMSSPQLAERLIAAEAQVDWKWVRETGGTVEDRASVAAAVDRLQRLPLRLEDQLERRVGAVRAAARRMAVCGGLGLVIVDYLGLLVGRRRESRTVEVTEVVQELKGMAMDLRVPVVALVQLSREVDRRSGEERRPQLDDLRDSGELEATADVVAFLHRRSVYELDAPASEAELIVAKQRQGPEGRIPLIFRGERFSFREPYHGEQL